MCSSFNHSHFNKIDSGKLKGNQQFFTGASKSVSAFRLAG